MSILETQDAGFGILLDDNEGIGSLNAQEIEGVLSVVSQVYLAIDAKFDEAGLDTNNKSRGRNARKIQRKQRRKDAASEINNPPGSKIAQQERAGNYPIEPASIVRPRKRSRR